MSQSISTRLRRPAVKRAAQPALRAWRGLVAAISLPGRIVAATGAVTLAAGLTLRWAELVFMGAVLLAALLVGALLTIGRTSYAVKVDLTPRRVVVGSRAYGRLAVRNSGERRVLPSRLELPVGSVDAEFPIPRLGPGEEHEELFAVPTERRAVILAGPARSVRGDQLGLVRRTQRWTGRIELFVHPRTTRLRASAQGLVHDLEGRETKTVTDSDLSFHALRSYEPGDDLRNVHWRTTARTGKLMVRQYQETRRSQLLLVLGTDARQYRDADEFELAVSAFASIGTQVVAEESGLAAGWHGHRISARNTVSLLDESCRAELSQEKAPSMRELVRTIGLRRQPPSVVIAIVGSRTSAHQLRTLAGLYGGDVVYSALQIDTAGEPAVRRIGSVVVGTVTALHDLSPIVSRVGTQS